MRPSVSLALVLALLGGPTSADARQAQAPAKPVIEELRAVRADGQLVVSFRVQGSLTEEILERIHSGIPVDFEHDVQVVVRRAVPLWTAHVLARERSRVEVAYDPLTRRYDLVRERERRRGGRPEPAPPAERSTVASIGEVEDWMAAVETAWPAEVLESVRADRLRLRVESTLGRRYVLLLFPGRVSLQAECEIAP